MAERTDDRDRLADVDAVEQLRHLGPLDLRAAHPERRDPGPLNQVEDLVAVLFADGVAEDRAEQPNVFAHRLGGFAAYSGALYRAEGLQRVGCFSHTYQYQGGWPTLPFVGSGVVFDPQRHADDGDQPNADDEQRQSVEVLLHHRRPGQAGLHATAEQRRQAATLSAVQQHQEYHQDAGHHQGDLQGQFHGPYLTGLRSTASDRRWL